MFSRQPTHELNNPSYNSLSVSDAVESILASDQWLWQHQRHTDWEHQALSVAVRQAVNHFAGLFSALIGPQSGAINLTRAKVLISAILFTSANDHALSEPGSTLTAGGNTTRSPSQFEHRRHWSSRIEWLVLRLCASFRELCLAPSSVELQRNFLRKHISLTLALLRTGLGPSELAHRWTADVADAVPASRIGRYVAASAVLHAVQLRRQTAKLTAMKR